MLEWLRLLASKVRALFAAQAPTPEQSEPPTAPPVVVEIVAAPERPAIDREQRKQRRAQTKALIDARRKLSDALNKTLDAFEGLSRRSAEIFDSRTMEGWRGIAGKDFVFLDDIIDTVDDLQGADRWSMLHPDAFDADELLEAVWPLEGVGAVFVNNDTKSLQFMHAETVTAKQWRGRIKFVPNKIVQLSQLEIFENGEWWGEAFPAGLIGDRWRFLDVGMDRCRVSNINGDMLMSSRKRTQKVADDADHVIRGLCSLALSKRYHWHVGFSVNQSPRLLVSTNPTGCLNFFQDRERNPNSGRRAALRHWVGNHLRELHSAEVVYVRDHLRGSTRFNWYGFDCNLMVSDFDLEKNELFKAEADRWREARKHNYGKLRLKKRNDNEAAHAQQ